MRIKAPWTESLLLEIVSGYVKFLLLGACLFAIFTCSERPAHAQLYLDVAGGMTQFLITAPDGDYLQRSLPHSLDTRSLAYKVGAGWRFNERWSIQGGYLNLGTVNQSAIFVSDENYLAKGGHCINGCPGRANYRITDAYHGGELTITRTFQVSEAMAWHLKGGGAYLMHRFTITKEDGSGQVNQHYGQFPAVIAGAGVSYKWAYLETDYYHGLGGSNGFMGHDQGWPLSKEMLVTWFGVKIPLS